MEIKSENDKKVDIILNNDLYQGLLKIKSMNETENETELKS